MKGNKRTIAFSVVLVGAALSLASCKRCEIDADDQRRLFKECLESAPNSVEDCRYATRQMAKRVCK